MTEKKKRSHKKKPPPPPKEYVTATKLGKLSGVHHQTILNWAMKGIIFRDPVTKKFEVESSLAFIKKNRPSTGQDKKKISDQKRIVEKTSLPKEITFQLDKEFQGLTAYEAETLKKVYDAAKRKLEVSQLDARLIDREKAYRLFYSELKKIRDRLVGIPAKIMEKLAAETDPYVCEDIMLREVTDTLEDIANEYDELAGQEDSVQGDLFRDPTGASADGEPVGGTVQDALE